MTKKARRIAEDLARMYPDAGPELDFTSPYELLVATVLSAQCTDVRVNQVTKELFQIVQGPADMLALERSALEGIIQSCGMYKQKARSLQEAAADLLEKHNGQVPDRREALQALRGVGTKTASVVLSNAFGVPAFAVDTHVSRVSKRLGLTRQTDPDKIAADLEKKFDKDIWTIMHHRMIFHGRRCCKARKPECERCLLEEICPKTGVTRDHQKPL